MKKILVTGGDGFIGSHLIDKLSEEYNIVIFDTNKRKAFLPSNVSYVKGNLTDLFDLRKTGRNLEGVVHLGAVSGVSDGFKNPLRCMNVNVMGTMNVLELARNSKNSPWIIIGSTNETTTNIYGLSKLTSELCGKRYTEDYNIEVLVLKFSSVYGPSRDNKNKLIPKLILRSLNNQDITLDNSKKSFDFIYIEDLVNGILKGIKYLENIQRSYYDAIPLCTGKSTNLRQLTELIIRETFSDSRIIIDREQEENWEVPNPEKAKNILNFETQIDIKEGIAKTVQYLKKEFIKK